MKKGILAIVAEILEGKEDDCEEAISEEEDAPTIIPQTSSLYKVLAPNFGGCSKASKMRKLSFPPFIETYMDEYSKFVLVPERTSKIRQNAISKASRAKAFVKYMMIGWKDITYWTWEFITNVQLIKVRHREKTTVATNSYFFSSFECGQAKDMVRHVRRVWVQMGLPGSPSLLDIRSAVATYNFEQNTAEARAEVAKFMCHSVATQERFHALHNTVALASRMRQLFVWTALDDQKPAADPPTSSAPCTSSAPATLPSPKKTPQKSLTVAMTERGC